jgi:hypothetical protein
MMIRPVSAAFRAFLFLVAIFFTFASCATFSHHDHDHDHHADGGRLLVHTDDGTIHVIDAGDGDILVQYRSALDPGPATVNASSSGEFGFVTHRETWQTAVIDSGYMLEDHGDHGDLIEGEPSLLGTLTTGAKPAYFSSALGKSIIYNDDDGIISLFHDDKLRDTLAITEIPARIDHGAPVITGDALVTGYLNAPEIDVIAWDGTLLQTLPSGTRLHGQARLGRYIGFGVMEGIVLLTRDGSIYSSKVLPYPPGFPEGGRVGNLRSHVLTPHFIGHAGSFLIKINPSSERMETKEMPSDFSLSGFDETGRYFVVLGKDGVLYSVDPYSLEIKASIKVAEPEEGFPAPALCTGKRHAWVSDPVTGTVAAINLEHMEIEAELKLKGSGKISGIALMQPEGVVH